MPTKLPTALKPIEWVGSSKEDLMQFPPEAAREVGHALYLAQLGRKAPSVKPLRGDDEFAGAVALEIVEPHDGDTFRAVYTAKLEGVVYVLHAFQKKSKNGISTPLKEITMIKRRLKMARALHIEQQKKRGAS